MADKKEKKYLIDNPTLMAEWNWEKNNELGLDPKTLTCGSDKKVWWKCEKKHEWQATIANRNNGRNCPYCSGKKVLKGYNDLTTIKPALAKEWNYEKNGNLQPENITIGSGKKVWWKCAKGHEWQAIVSDRNRGNACPFCMNTKVLIGFNDLTTLNPQLAKEWNYEKNGNLKPEDITAGSNKKAWWKCDKGHEWQAIISKRNDGRGCPYCVGKKTAKGYNDLATLNQTLAKEWNYEKNGNLKPENFTVSSNKKVWWKCDKGHEWQALIGSRNKGHKCPYCKGLLAIVGSNDLATLNPSLAKQWHYEKNGNLKPENFTVGSNVKAWWKCSKGHEWQANIVARHKGNNCPYCSGRYAIKGENDLATITPKLSSEWNYEKNGNLKPEDFMTSSGKKVWWKCAKGHEWKTKICHRSNGSDCPICNSEYKTSLPEFAILYYLKKYGVKTVHSYKEKGYELDIYMPFKKIAIEYDGYLWHGNKTKNDLDKNLKCKNDGITLYRIREGLESLNDSSIDYIINKNQKDLEEVLQKVLSEIVGFSIDIDLKRDNIEIENLREYTEKMNSLLYINPTLSIEWNYEKNGNLRPEHFTAGSNKKAWWKCSKGHEWQAVIVSRNKGHGCPYCSGRKK